MLLFQSERFSSSDLLKEAALDADGCQHTAYTPGRLAADGDPGAAAAQQLHLCDLCARVHLARSSTQRRGTKKQSRAGTVLTGSGPPACTAGPVLCGQAAICN